MGQSPQSKDERSTLTYPPSGEERAKQLREDVYADGGVFLCFVYRVDFTQELTRRRITENNNMLIKRMQGSRNRVDQLGLHPAGRQSLALFKSKTINIIAT